MNTPTPQTDKHMECREDFERCDPDFARTLETELTHANNRAHNWEQATIAHLKDKDQLHADIAELNERLIDRQKTLMAELVKNSSGNRNPCDWKQDNDGNWDTSCKQCMCFDYAPPFDQGYKFCHHCGKPIKFIEHEPEPPFEDFGGME
jgi:hypothetical protein